MPDNLDRLLEVAELDRGNVRQVVVALRRIVVQPTDHVVHTRRVDNDCRLTPHDVDASDGGAELLPERLDAFVRCTAAMRDVFRCYRRRRAGAERASRDNRGEATVVVHKPERV
jgi:hypothetical protein